MFLGSIVDGEFGWVVGYIWVYLGVRDGGSFFMMEVVFL